jgi:AcrR family transcriptional regulator
MRLRRRPDRREKQMRSRKAPKGAPETDHDGEAPAGQGAPSAGPGRRAHSKSIEKRKRILDAAARALAEHGYSEAKLSDIAQEAGTHAGALYYYFPSREDLIQEVMLTSLDRITEFSEGLLQDKTHQSALDRLLAFVRALVQHQAAQHDDYYLRAYLRNGDHVPESLRTVIKARRRQLRRTLTCLIGEAQASGQIPAQIDTNVAAQFIIGATNWMSLWYEPGGPTSADDIADTFVGLVLHGVTGGEPRVAPTKAPSTKAVAAVTATRRSRARGKP